jgi:hypothetical protein
MWKMQGINRTALPAPLLLELPERCHPSTRHFNSGGFFSAEATAQRMFVNSPAPYHTTPEASTYILPHSKNNTRGRMTTRPRSSAPVMW